MPRIGLFVEAFQKEMNCFKTFPSVVGGYISTAKSAGADYLMARMNYMLTKYALNGAIDVNEFYRDTMVNTVNHTENYLEIKNHPLKYDVGVEINQLLNYRITGVSRKDAQIIADKLEVFSSTVLSNCKTDKDYEDAKKQHTAIINNLPRYVLPSFNNIVYEERTNATVTLKSIAVRHNNLLKERLEKLIGNEIKNNVEFEGFDNPQDLITLINDAFRDIEDVDYKKLEKLNNLEDSNGNKYHFLDAAKLSTELKQYVRGVLDTGEFANISEMDTVFKKYTEIAEKKISDKKMFRYATLATNEKIISSYMAEKEETLRHINDSDIGVRVKKFKYSDAVSNAAIKYLDGMQLNCSSDVRLEKRLSKAINDFNHLTDDKNDTSLEKQVAIIKALEIKHSQRNLIWRMFNFIRSGEEIETIIKLKTNLIERGFSKERLDTMLNESSSEKKLYRMPQFTREVDELFQKPVDNPYYFEELAKQTKEEVKDEFADFGEEIEIEKENLFLSDDELETAFNNDNPKIDELDTLENQNDNIINTNTNYDIDYLDNNIIDTKVRFNEFEFEDFESEKSIDDIDIDKEFKMYK